MQPRGYDLEIGEFVRVQLGKRGKKRSTNVWMDYVKEQESISRAAEAAESERQQQLYYQQQKKAKGEADWAATMADTSIFEDALDQHLSMDLDSDTAKKDTTSIDDVWPPLNRNSPWGSMAKQSVAGKGSALLNQAQSYTFTSWATKTEQVLPPLSPDARIRMSNRTASSSRIRRTLAFEKKVGDAEDPRTRSAPIVSVSSPKVLTRLRKAHESGLVSDPRTCQVCLKGQYSGPPDHMCMTCGHVHKSRKKESDRQAAERLEQRRAKEARLEALTPDPDGYDDAFDTEWTKFMEEHEKKVRDAKAERARLERERQRQHEETGFLPPPVSTSAGFEGKVIDPEKLPPSALLRGRRVLDRDAVPMEPSRRRMLRLEEDFLRTCTDPSKILPIPTLNSRHFGEILRDFGAQLGVREEMIGMENEERQMRSFLRAEARQKRLQESKNNEEKAKNALIMFMKRGMIQCYLAWKDYAGKMISCKRFMRKLLQGKQMSVFKAFKENMMRRRHIKNHGMTQLQRHTRGFVARRKYGRLRKRTKAHDSIRRSWRAYCARTLLERMIRKREEEERRIRSNIRKMLLRSAHKVLLAWQQHTRIMKYAANMGLASVKKMMRHRFRTWSSNVNLIMFRKPLAAKSIQRMARAYFVRVSLAKAVKRIKAAIKIQRMVRAWVAQNLLVRVKAKRNALMLRVRKRMLEETHAIMRICLQLLFKNAKKQISLRQKLSGFLALKTRKLLSAWRQAANTQVKERIVAAVIIQAGYRGLLGRRRSEMLKMERDQAEADRAQKEAMRGLDTTLMDKGPRIDPKTGLPIILRTTPRLELLKREKKEVNNIVKKAAKAQKQAGGKYASKSSKKAANVEEFKFFDSQVLSFSQRFRLRTETSFLIGFLDSEIKKETWKIWKEDREKEIEAARKEKEMLEADEKRAAEMEKLLDEANRRRAEMGGSKLKKLNTSYPTAGIMLNFKGSSRKDMELALDNWLGLMEGGFLPRETLISWISRGIMNQKSAEQRVRAWNAVKAKLDRQMIMDVNIKVGTEKREALEALQLSGGKHEKSLLQQVLAQPGEVARKRRWKFRL